MSKTTSTLLEIITGELHFLGYNEFFNNGKLTFFDDKSAFIKKVMTYDKDVEKIVTLRLFNTFEFDNAVVDKTFKQMFLNKFLDREIGFQTIEVFASKCYFLTKSHENYINEIILNLSKYVLNHTDSNTLTTGKNESSSQTDSDSDSLNKHRSVNNDLPRNLATVSLDEDFLQYANNNQMSNNSTETTTNQNVQNESNSESETTTKTDTYSLDKLRDSARLLENLFNIYDEKLFLQRW